MREAADGEREAVVQALALAFEDDPVMAYLFPDAATRRRRLAGFYRVVVPMLERQGVVHTSDGIHGAAVWQAPRAWDARPGWLEGAWLGIRMLLALRGSAERAQILNDLVRLEHIREPHWYLALLGTEPAQQGRGLGSALIAPMLARCDDEGTLAYLESSKRENLPFYERHGFAVVRELRLPDGPPLWPMLRQPANVRLEAFAQRRPANGR